ncbi:MAG TPA: DUF2955 domain-containing protein [Dongiaceae bacterium]|nr:DUF2955 domain-containing protein [Dongiaceae bacterium]
MPPEAASREQFRRTLRIALVMALGLTVAEARDQPFAFLSAMFAVQLLIKSPNAPNLVQGVGFAIIMAVSTGVALSLCGMLLDRPVAYLLLLSLVIVGCFWLLAQGRGGPLPQFLLLCNVMIPVLAVQSRDLAADFAAVMIDASVAAPLLVWLAHGLLPAAHVAQAPAQTAPAPSKAVESALVAFIVLILPFVYFMLNPEAASFVILVTIIGIAVQPPEARGLAAMGLLLGNLIGGIVASMAFFLLTLLPWLGLLFLVTFLAGLVLAGPLHGGGRLAPVFGIALSTFLILFGLGLAPIGEGSAAAFVSRLADVALASLYALGAIVLLGGMSRSPAKAPA